MFPGRVLKLALTTLTLSSHVVSSENATVKQLIIDADLFEAIDDAAALLLACTLPNTKLLAVNVNVNSSYSALAASAIVNYYGYPSIPIGLPRPYANITSPEPFGGEYASEVAEQWSGGSAPWFHPEKTWDPVELYRKTLSEAANSSITIVSIGFTGSISGLLNSTADAYSPLDGYALVEEKIKELVLMGGGYMPYPSLDADYNLRVHGAHVVNTWPDCVPMTFLGAELGLGVFTGAPLTVYGPPNDPVKAAFQWWGGYNISQYSWDHMTMVYAAGGLDGVGNLGDWFEYGNVNGYNHVFPNITNVWVEDPSRASQHFLKLKVSNETVAVEMDRLLLRGAWKHAEDE